MTSLFISFSASWNSSIEFLNLAPVISLYHYFPVHVQIHIASFLELYLSYRKSLLLASGILVAGGTAAYMQSRFSRKQHGSFGNFNGSYSSTEGSENENSNPTVYNGKRQKKTPLRSLQVLAAILLSQIGRRGTCDLLALVSVVVSFFIGF